ncbi:Uncharacterised protein [Mycobacteroides abscessus subsp. abscessus]|nr:Uncharacterised protein [Mycobacteroides abscessus subsp. abscessus]
MLRMKSNSPRCFSKKPSSVVDRVRAAPSSSATSALRRLRESTVTSAPLAAAIWTPMWPRPPRPSTATLSPAPTFQRAMGE